MALAHKPSTNTLPKPLLLYTWGLLKGFPSVIHSLSMFASMLNMSNLYAALDNSWKQFVNVYSLQFMLDPSVERTEESNSISV